MKLELISFPTCPFVQRAVIVLLEKKVKHDIRYIDLSKKPEWFLKISPRGKVPLLIADGVTLFESQAICEYLEETHPTPPLFPKDPVWRARDRAWFAFVGEDLFMPMYRFMYATEKEKAEEYYSKLLKKLKRLDGELEGRDFLSGEGKTFGLADVALAPFTYRVGVLKEENIADLFATFKNLPQYAAHINDRSSVQNSVPKDFAEQTLKGLKKNASYLLSNKLSE